MLEVAGAGRAHALNGPVRVLFSRNPASDSYFGSLNGDVEVGFRAGLSAELRFATFNGQVYSAFPFTRVAGDGPTHERAGGKNVYRFGSTFGGRVGGGGPRIDLHCFHGGVRILDRRHRR